MGSSGGSVVVGVSKLYINPMCSFTYIYDLKASF
jgi:hypothetical protein